MAVVICVLFHSTIAKNDLPRAIIGAGILKFGYLNKELFRL